MSIIPKNIEDWNLETINELTKLRDIESEIFDFKSTDIGDLSKHLCAFANTEGGFVVLGIDEVKNEQILLEFKKRGFKVGKEDEIKKQIKNFQIQIDPIPKLQIKPIYDGEKFFIVIKIDDNNLQKPHCIKQQGAFYVRIGSSSEPASRTTIINLFSDMNQKIEDFQNLRSSIIIVQEELSQRITKFRKISSAPPNRLPKLDLTLLRNNVVKCESFLREKNLLGHKTENSSKEGTMTILDTLDTLNSYIDGFSKSTDSEIKEDLQDQIKINHYSLFQALERVNPFFDKLIREIDDQVSKIKNN